jgi:hypothetical protein
VQASLPGLRALDPTALAATIKLADVQHAIARARGFSSWADLTRCGDPLAALLTAVRGGHLGTFRRDLGRFFGLADTHVLAACALGDADALRERRAPAYARHR